MPQADLLVGHRGGGDANRSYHQYHSLLLPTTNRNINNSRETMPPIAPDETTCGRERKLSWGQQVDLSPLKSSTSTNTFATTASSVEESSPALLRLKDTLAAIPSRGYVSNKTATPVEHMPRLTRLCGGPELYVKRDDLLPLAGGGSKTRKLGAFEDDFFPAFKITVVLYHLVVNI